MLAAEKLLLRGASDLVVLRKPSWWVVQRALLVVGFAAVAGLGALVWIQRLRRRVAQRTAELNATMEKLQKEARMSATLAERDRLAGEIHDARRRASMCLFDVRPLARAQDLAVLHRDGLG